MKAFEEVMHRYGGREKIDDLSRFKRLMQKIGVVAMEKRAFDTYDVVHHVSEAKNGCIYGGIARDARMYVPSEHRDQVLNSLSEIGISSENVYVQNMRTKLGAEVVWAQLTLEDDPEFQLYAGIRKLLDDAPQDRGVVYFNVGDDTT